MGNYTAIIYDHSGTYDGFYTSSVEGIEEIRFDANTDEEAFTRACNIIYERIFDRDKGLIINPDGNLVQRLESLLQGSRVVDCSSYELKHGLEKNPEGKIYAMRKRLDI